MPNRYLKAPGPHHTGSPHGLHRHSHHPFEPDATRGWGSPEAFDKQEIGTPCAKASNYAKCTESLKVAVEDPSLGWDQRSGEFYLPPRSRAAFFTRQDTVGTLASTNELQAFVAPVDTIGDAAFLASETLRIPFNCTTDLVTPIPGGGYEVTFYVAKTDCSYSSDTGKYTDHHQSTETKVRVQVDGTVGEPTVKVLNRGDTPAQGCAVAGRRHESFVVFQDSSAPALGRFFVAMAALESAAVPAFLRLAAELKAHGAPAHLIDEAEHAAVEEVRHARTMSKLARQFGASPPVVQELSFAPRDLLAMAIENAVEGCVRETFGGLLATYQSQHAEDERVARVFRAIAEDETGHGALAWAVDAWLQTVLSDEDKRVVSEARQHAMVALLDELRSEPNPEVAKAAGLPSAEVATALCQALGQGLFSHERAA